MAELIVPDWPAPANVRAAMTTRDLDAATPEGRQQLRAALQLPAAPAWLKQVHGINVVNAAEAREPEGDASFTTQAGIVCVAQAADCLPVLFCDDAGSVVAAAHAGWRGLAAGVLEATVRALPVAPETLMAWLGPAIGPRSFEVGADVREAFIARDREAAEHFAPRHPRASGAPQKFLADLYGLARQRLAAAGVTRVSGGGLDTFADPRRFFSFRRDGRCGRMAALVWLVR